MTDAYGAFLTALRAWLADQGAFALAMSFYGMRDARTALVVDDTAFPLLGLLHYLIRSQGCSRVLETGTARGVSAACLASAVAHRENACVVTLDPVVYPERADLWDRLPNRMRLCIIDQRRDSLDWMGAAAHHGNSFHAALLDSVHTEEHVLAEFELATRLVCPGGLILVHDATLPSGTVGAALDRIRADGYGVATLWAAEGGVREDDGLGLAVIENRRRP